jgi:hypothetical protein
VTRIGELGATQAATSNRHTLRGKTLMMEAPGSSETSDLTRGTRHNIPEDTFVHSHRRENLKPYIVNVIPNTQNLVTLMTEAIYSSETSILTRDTRHNIPQDGIL